MKRTKKAAALMLALLIAMSMMLPAFAAGSTTVVDGLKVATDDYDVADGTYGEITGTVTGTLVAKDGYIAAGNGFHKFGGQYISSVSLRPQNAGIYYKSQIQCDEMVSARIKASGVILNAAEAPSLENMETTSIYTTTGTSCRWSAGIFSSINHFFRLLVPPLRRIVSPDCRERMRMLPWGSKGQPSPVSDAVMR